jgi:hypothetical protein
MRAVLASLALLVSAVTVTSCESFPIFGENVTQEQALAVAELTYQGGLETVTALAEQGLISADQVPALRTSLVRADEALDAAHRLNSLGDLTSRDAQIEVAQMLLVELATRLNELRSEGGDP